MPTVEPAAGRPSGPARPLLRELGAFGVVGATAFLVDVGLFHLLYVSGLDPVAAKLAATLVATAVAYTGHRYWSFAHRVRRSVRRSFVLFASVNGTTLLIGLGIVWFARYPLGQESALVLQAANLASIALGTAIRFLAYRRWVFPARSPATGPASPAPAARVQVPVSSPAGTRSGR